MYQIKSQIYIDFDKTQKSGICNYIRALVKQNLGLTCSEILDKFLYDEKYYLEQKSSRFPFLSDFIELTSFQKETQAYINECKKYYDYKEAQRPFIEKQKEFTNYIAEVMKFDLNYGMIAESEHPFTSANVNICIFNPLLIISSSLLIVIVAPTLLNIFLYFQVFYQDKRV